MEALEQFEISIDEVMKYSNIREEMKKKIITYQKNILLKNMLEMSKPDGVTLQFSFDGKEVKYLQLPFQKARVILMLRSRMFPTKSNFKERWINNRCEFCNMMESDVHLFNCPGYTDLNNSNFTYNMFFNLDDVTMPQLDEGAAILIKMLERLQTINM